MLARRFEAFVRAHTGNHIVLVRNELVFDSHGFSEWSREWAHTRRRANRWWPGWSADIVSIRRDALVSRRQAYSVARL